jgi:hypothetical protein
VTTAILAALLFALLYTQTRQGPLDACWWLLLRLRAVFILFSMVLGHLRWWVPAHWAQAMADARNEPMAVEVSPPVVERLEPLPGFVDVVRRWWRGDEA